MVKGNRKAKIAAREAMAENGSYTRSKRIVDALYLDSDLVKFDNFHDMRKRLSIKSISAEEALEIMVFNRCLIPDGEALVRLLIDSLRISGISSYDKFISMAAGEYSRGTFYCNLGISNVLADFSNETIEVFEAREPSFIAGSVERARVLKVREDHPDFGINNEPMSMSAVINDGRYRSLYRSYAKRHDELSAISYQNELLTIAERHGVDYDELEDLAWQ